MKPEIYTDDQVTQIGKKWIPVLESKIDNFNRDKDNLSFKMVLSLFCEWYSVEESNGFQSLIGAMNQPSTLPDKIDEILTNFEDKHIGNLEEVNKCRMNNTYRNRFNRILNFQEVNDLFGSDFTKKLYPSLHRDKKIDEIIS